MKKIYITPSLMVVKLDAERIIAQSGVYSSYGMGYGGVDTSGEEDVD